MIETLKEYYNMDEDYATYVAKQIMQGPSKEEVTKGYKVINYVEETRRCFYLKTLLKN